MLSLVDGKILFIFLCFFVTLACTLLPYAVRRFFTSGDANANRRNFIESILNCFSAGVFLGTTFLHLIPETSEHYDEVAELGFMKELAPNKTALAARLTEVHHNELAHHEGGEEEAHGFPIAFLVMMCGFFAVYLMETSVEAFIDALHRRRDKVHIAKVPGTEMVERKSSVLTASVKDAPRGHGTEVGSLFDAVTLVVALTIHSVLEGITIGISLTTSALAARAISISLHKVFVAVITGGQVCLACLHRPMLMVILCAVFSIATPIGVAIGTGLTESNAESLLYTPNQYVIVVLEAISAGMFVYIAFFELLLKEQSKPKEWELWQAVACTVGAAVISTILAVFH